MTDNANQNDMNDDEKEQWCRDWMLEIDDPCGWLSKPQRRKIRLWMLERLHRHFPETLLEDVLTEEDRVDLLSSIHFASEDTRYRAVDWRVLVAGTTRLWQVVFLRPAPPVAQQIAEQRDIRRDSLRNVLRTKIATRRDDRQPRTNMTDALYKQLRQCSTDETFRRQLPTPQQIQADPEQYRMLLQHTPASAAPLRKYLQLCLVGR